MCVPDRPTLLSFHSLVSILAKFVVRAGDVLGFVVVTEKFCNGPYEMAQNMFTIILIINEVLRVLCASQAILVDVQQNRSKNFQQGLISMQHSEKAAVSCGFSLCYCTS